MFIQKSLRRRSRSYIALSLSVVLILEQPLYAGAAGASSPTANGSTVNSSVAAMKAAEAEPSEPLNPDLVLVPLFCESRVLMECSFEKTLADAEKNRAEIEALKKVDCSSTTFDAILGSVSSIFSAAPSEGAAQNAATVAAGAAATQTAAETKKTECAAKVETQIASLEKIKASIEADNAKCESWIAQVAQNCFLQVKAEHSAELDQGVSAATIARNESQARNTAALQKANATAESWVEKTTAFLEKYGFVMLAAIGGIIGLIMALSSSGKKKQDLFQNQMPNTTANTPSNKNPNGNNKNPATTDNSSDKNNSVTDNSRAGACGTDLKPLECFVSSGCDLKCVSDKYGVSNYGGMGNDTTRIDKNGRAVDSTNYSNKNPGNSDSTNSSQAANTGSGGASGAGKIGGGSSGTPNAPGETGSSNSEGVGARSVVSSGGGDGEGYAAGGGSGYGGGDGSGRGPANDRYKPGDIVTKSQALKNAMANGPILPPTSNLFERIWTTTRNQCIRDEVICQSK